MWLHLLPVTLQHLSCPSLILPSEYLWDSSTCQDPGKFYETPLQRKDCTLSPLAGQMPPTPGHTAAGALSCLCCLTLGWLSTGVAGMVSFILLDCGLLVKRRGLLETSESTVVPGRC